MWVGPCSEGQGKHGMAGTGPRSEGQGWGNLGIAGAGPWTKGPGESEHSGGRSPEQGASVGAIRAWQRLVPIVRGQGQGNRGTAGACPRSNAPGQGGAGPHCEGPRLGHKWGRQNPAPQSGGTSYLLQPSPEASHCSVRHQQLLLVALSTAAALPNPQWQRLVTVVDWTCQVLFLTGCSGQKTDTWQS